MRLHRLSVQAFGPFPGHVEVDLDALSSAGIFLIHGPTGAGKTSLLDAICFALYAAVPGARPGGRSLRSDHAGPDAVPRVALELTAAGRRLRIARSPEFRRPKRRGSGETTVPASVTLAEWLGSEWAPLSHRADEVGDVVKDVLGIGMQQFVKVVLLPQGDFAAFLRATPETRRELLERLFDVSRFTDVEEWLADQRRRSGVALAETTSALAAGLTRVDDVLARLPHEMSNGLPTWDSVPHGELEGLMASLVCAARQFAADALAERDAAEVEERERVTARDAAARQLVCQRKAGQAAATLADLDARQDELTALAERVAVARRASCIAGDLRALADATARTRAARERATAAAGRVVELGPGIDAMDAGAAQRLAEVLSKFEACLAEEAALGQALAQARSRIVEQQRVTVAAQQRWACLETDVAGLVAAATEVAERHREAGAAAAVVPEAQQEVDEVIRLLRVRATLDTGLARLSDARERTLAAHEAARVAHGRWLQLRQEQLDGLAARLAADLVDGQPCPVCGSGRHPRPADAAAAVPDDSVAAAEAQWAARRAVLAAAQRDVSSHEGQVLALREQAADPDRDAQTLAADLAAARDRLSTAQAHADELAALDERREQLTVELTTVREQRDEAGRAMQQAGGRLDAMPAEVGRTECDLNDRRRRHTEGCPCATSAPDDRVDASTRHTELAAAVAELLDATRSETDAKQHGSGLAQAVADRLADKGFYSVDAARAALVPENTLAGHERRLSQAERERVQAQTVLADPEVAQALSADEPDLAALDEQLAQARRARQLADRTVRPGRAG